MLPQVKEKFVRTGKVELIFLDLPLQMHPQALKAAQAAACAGDQGKFWEMHDHLFARQNALGPDRLPEYAKEVGLDVTAFQKCLSGSKHVAGIREDVREANVILGINSTPVFLLGRRVPDSDKVEILEIVKGLPPYDVLEEKIEALLPPTPPQ